jgi:acetyl esterase
LPPAYLTVAEFDPLHDEGLEYGLKLKTAGVACEIVDYPGLVHDFIYFQSVLPQAAVALKAAAQALKKALKAG